MGEREELVAMIDSALTVFIRREKTTDEVLLKYAPKAKKQDIVIYKDREATNLLGRIPWFHRGKPTKRSKGMMINCCWRPIVWIE
jgi:hypothetical protein